MQPQCLHNLHSVASPSKLASFPGPCPASRRLQYGESRYVQTCSWEKNYGFTPNLDFNPLPTRFNLTEFLPTSKSMQHIEGEENK